MNQQEFCINHHIPEKNPSFFDISSFPNQALKIDIEFFGGPCLLPSLTLMRKYVNISQGCY